MNDTITKRTWERRMETAKAKHRPKLRDWSRDGFASKRVDDFLACSSIDPVPGNLTKLKIGRVSIKGCSPDNFVKYFEKQYKPCIISGIPDEEGWTATKAWTFDAIRDRFKDRMFKVGEDDDGYKVKAKMKYFLQYLKENVDDSPLYIFDSNYDEDSVSKSILSDYRVPSYFRDDLFSLVGEKRRPPCRWFLLGPQRSGSCVHLDPLATSAWNTVTTGRKRWVLFPPDTPRRVVKGLDVLRAGEDDEAVNYFVDLLPRIKQRYGAEVSIMEFVQEEGETVYVPGGWWHGVLNLTDTVAITQNFCSYSNFDAVWRSTRGGRKKMAVRWLRELHAHHPALGRRAEALNAEDGFQMYSRAAAERAREEKQRNKAGAEAASTGGVDGGRKAGKRRSAEDSSSSGGSGCTSGSESKHSQDGACQHRAKRRKE